MFRHIDFTTIDLAIVGVRAAHVPLTTRIRFGQGAVATVWLQDTAKVVVFEEPPHVVAKLWRCGEELQCNGVIHRSASK